MAFDPTEYAVAADHDGGIYLICDRCDHPIEVTDLDDEMPTLADIEGVARLHHAGTINHIEQR